MTIEKLANQIMKECAKEGEPVTLEEAIEMAKIELASKKNVRYEKSDNPRKTSSKERKVDEDKKKLLGCIKTLLEGLKAVITATKTETEISFVYNENQYTLKLIKHRAPKDSPL